MATKFRWRVNAGKISFVIFLSTCLVPNFSVALRWPGSISSSTPYGGWVSWFWSLLPAVSPRALLMFLYPKGNIWFDLFCDSVRILVSSFTSPTMMDFFHKVIMNFVRWNSVRNFEGYFVTMESFFFHRQVYTLMKFDCYPRFLKSDVYRQSLEADLEGAPLPGEEGEVPREFKSRGSSFWKVKLALFVVW